jgi:hypothetical protein
MGKEVKGLKDNAKFAANNIDINRWITDLLPIR